MRVSICMLIACMVSACGNNEMVMNVPDAAPVCDLSPGNYQQVYILQSGGPADCPKVDPRQVVTDGKFSTWSSAPSCDTGCSIFMTSVCG